MEHGEQYAMIYGAQLMLELSVDNWDSLHLVETQIHMYKFCNDYVTIMHVSGSIARTRAYFGRGTAPILLDDVACTGTESRLVYCRYDSITSDCSHSEDAGVTCQASAS